MNMQRNHSPRDENLKIWINPLIAHAKAVKFGKKKAENALFFHRLKLTKDAVQTEQVELIIYNSVKGNQVGYLEDIT